MMAAFVASMVIPMPLNAFFVWLLLFYFTLLVWETATVIRIVQKSGHVNMPATSIATTPAGGMES